MLITNTKTVPLGNYDGFRTWVLIGEVNTGSKEISIQLTEVDPGRMQFLHAHPQAQCYYILQGTGLVIINDEEREVKSGDAVFIPSNATHGIRNIGADRLLYMTANQSFGIKREKELWATNPVGSL